MSYGNLAKVSDFSSQGTRRLAAIMFTDMVGYSALSDANEDLALKLLNEHRSLVRPIFAAFSGREIKNMADGFLVEFGSAVEAVKCALQIQEAMSANTGEGKVEMRIGIHVGP